MDYAYFHSVVDGLDTVLFIILIVGFVWTWFGNNGDKYE